MSLAPILYQDTRTVHKCPNCLLISPTICPTRYLKNIITSRNGKPPSLSYQKIKRMPSSLISKNISLPKGFLILMPVLEK